jgi:hypothetical protein
MGAHQRVVDRIRHGVLHETRSSGQQRREPHLPGPEKSCAWLTLSELTEPISFPIISFCPGISENCICQTNSGFHRAASAAS